MGIQIIGTRKCRNTQKAERYFRERGIDYHFVDLSQRSLSPGELESISRAVGAEELVDKESAIYKKKGMAYMDYNPLEEIMENPLLMVTPVIRSGHLAAAGFDPEKLKEAGILP